MRRTRALWLGVAITLLPMPHSAQPRAEAAPLLGLREIALQKGVFIGGMVSNERKGELRDPDFVRALCSEFNMVSAGNALKWSVVQPREGEFNWAPAERLFAVAAACNLRLVGSPIVWKWQLPDWVTAYDGRPAKVRAILKTHITTLLRHFAGRVKVWDVVNEVVDFWGSFIDDFWSRNLGQGYVVDAFKWARAADPFAKLYYNDFAGDGMGPKGNGVYRWVGHWRSRGAPIDGVGVQAHGRLEARSADELVRNLRRYAAIGLETRLSEIAIPIGPGSVKNARQQARVFFDLAHACFSPGTGCRMFTVWGVSDRYYRPVAAWKHACCGTLLDEGFERKRAYFAVKAALDAA